MKGIIEEETEEVGRSTFPQRGFGGVPLPHVIRPLSVSHGQLGVRIFLARGVAVSPGKPETEDKSLRKE